MLLRKTISPGIKSYSFAANPYILYPFYQDFSRLKRVSAPLYALTTLTGLPSRKHFRLFTAIFISLCLASLVAQAICGVIRQFLALSSGLSSAGGSIETTSSPAPAIRPLFNASARSGPPVLLDVFMERGLLHQRQIVFVINPCLGTADSAGL